MWNGVNAFCSIPSRWKKTTGKGRTTRVPKIRLCLFLFWDRPPMRRPLDSLIWNRTDSDRMIVRGESNSFETPSYVITFHVVT